MTLIYNQDFSGGNTDSWRATYSSTADGETPYNLNLGVRTDEASVATGGIYWNDKNHLSPGIGRISLLAWNFAGSMGLGSHTAWQDATVRLRLRMVNSFLVPRYSMIVWWMQRTDPANPAKSWNMGFTGKPLCKALGYGPPDGRANNRYFDTGWTDIEFALSGKWDDWTCYGAAPAKTQYSCPLTPSDFLNGPMVNMGIHLVSWDNAAAYNAQVISGLAEMRISSIQIETP